MSPSKFLLAWALLPLLFASASFAADARDELTPAQAIKGHWVTKSGATHYYFGDASVVMVDGKTRQSQKYEVLESDKETDLLRVRIRVTATGGSHEKVLRFDTEKNGLLETVSIEVAGKRVHVSTLWHYVDDKIEP